MVAVASEIHSCRLPLESLVMMDLSLTVPSSFVWLTAPNAAWANPPDGSSTSGHVIMAAHPNIYRFGTYAHVPSAAR